MKNLESEFDRVEIDEKFVENMKSREFTFDCNDCKHSFSGTCLDCCPSCKSSNVSINTKKM